ncbi:MAG: CAP domain-containing protein [Acidimicrobiales bacterium]
MRSGVGGSRKGVHVGTWVLGAGFTAALVMAPTMPGAVHAIGTDSWALAPSTTVPAPTSTTTTTTQAPTTTTTAPPVRHTVTTTPPPAQHTAPAQAHRGILPPQEPPQNIAPSPNFLQDCQGSTYDDSTGCVNATLAAIANGRSAEGLSAMTLPSNWYSLTVTEQIFVITNLERTARGLPALSAMATSLDQAAAQGAQQSTDPSPPSGFPYSQWGSNWAGAVGNPLEAMYYWMYDDGMGSANIECTQSNHSGCWGHRDNVLENLPCNDCLMGTGYSATAWQGDPSMAEILVETSGNPAEDFTWAQEQAYF